MKSLYIFLLTIAIVAPSGAQIPTEGLVAYYPFNGNANDESGNGNNGTVHDATLTADRFGNPNSAYDFNGSSSYLLIDPPVINHNTSLTVSAWVKTKVSVQTATIIYERDVNGRDACGSTSAPNFGLHIWDHKFALDISTVDDQSRCLHTRIFSENAIEIDRWYFITGVFDKTGKTSKIYIDGELVSEIEVNNNLRTHPSAVTRIGRNSNLARQTWNGSLDDIRIYNRALSESEIKALYTDGGWGNNGVCPITDRLFYDDFSDPTIKSEWQILSGTWSIINGELRGTWSLGAAQTDQGVILIEENLYNNDQWIASVTVQYRSNQQGQGAERFVLRNSAGNQYLINYGIQNGKGFILPHYRVNRSTYRHIASNDSVNSFNTNNGDLNVITLMKFNNIFTVYVNGVKEVEFEDTIFDGQVKLGLGTYGTAYYTDFLLCDDGILEGKDADLSFLSDGPLSSEITVPTNGHGYAYFKMSSDGVDLDHDGVFGVNLLNGNQSISISARFLTPGVLRLDIPGTIFGESSEIKFTTPSSIVIGNTKYELSNDEISMTVIKQRIQYNRIWSIFAGGSAGVSGSLGSIGVGASVSAAKLSVKGEGGMGLELRIDQDKNTIFDRRLEVGVGASLQVPSVNFVVGSVDVFKAYIIPKTLVGQRLSFYDIGLSDTDKIMAQSGSLLETLAMGGAEISPTFGWVLKATINTLNNLSGLNQIFNDALISTYWGIGLEGELSAGAKVKVGPLSMTAIGANITGSLQSSIISNLRSAPNGIAKSNALYSNIGLTHKITLASNYQMSVLNLGLNFNDRLEISSGNFGLIDAGVGGEISYITSFDNSGNVRNIAINIMGGGETASFGPHQTSYFSTTLEFDGDYSNIFKVAGLGIASLYTSGLETPLGISMVEEGVNAFTTAYTNYYGKPIRINTYERRGIGFNINVGVDLDAALGVGLGLVLGVKVQCFDEIEFPRKTTDVYANGANYLLRSSEFSTQMAEDDIVDYITDMFSGLVPLIKTAMSNLWNSVSEYVQAGIIVIIDGYNAVADFVGSVKGSVKSAGQFVLSVFSPESPRVLYKAFELPEVRFTYISNEVYQTTISAEGQEQLIDTGTRLVIISESMNVGFIPEGLDKTIDQLDDPVKLSMLIKEEDLLKNDFNINDKDKVRIYYYQSDIIGWVRKGGTIDTDTISVDITRMGTYSLGIELNLEADNIPPEIYEYGPMEGSIWNEYPNIYAKIRDDRYGSGIDLANTFILLNDDTLGISYNPTEEMIFYQINREDGLEAGQQSVTIITSDLAGNQSTVTFSFQLTATGVGGADELPKDYALLQNYPNPFNMSTTIQFQLPTSSNIAINIYDVQGRYITTIFDGHLEAGTHGVVWDGTNSRGSVVSSGVYFYQLRGDNVNIVKKMNLVK